ncbi:MAG: hypothetical protein SFV15_24490 [Polyangiaceae bacterium]|nr:hypothetical protein [Polyangiaceae bacterium]
MSAHDHSCDHAEHAPFDPDALDPGEPHSPFWLPFVGIGLFLLGLGLFLVTRDPASAESTDGAAQKTLEVAKPAP